MKCIDSLWLQQKLSRNGMILGVILSAFFPMVAEASGAAGAMFSVQAVNLDYVHFGNPKASEDCGLARDDVSNAVKAALQASNLPTVTLAQPKPPIISVARVEVIPEITSINQGLDCVSWVSLSAQTENNLTIPPVEILRNVTISYWRQGALINSGQSIHQRAVVEAFQKMAASFGKQYRQDQIQ